MAHQSRHLARVLLVSALLAAPAICASASQPAKQPQAPVSPAPAADAQKQAEDLLTRLENADRGLTTMQSEIMLHRTFALAGDDQTRWGMLYFRQLPDAKATGGVIRQFAVRFDQLLIDRRTESKEQRFIFDGQWLAEVDPTDKHFNRKQLAAEGENFDPLRVGEGPLPIPIGQRKDDILSRFKAEVVPVTEGLEDADNNAAQAKEWRKFVQGSTQLKLTPRKDGEDADFTQIRLWYKPADKQEGIEDGRMLPRMSRTVNRAGDVTTVQLVGISLNFPTDDKFAKFFDTSAPAEGGWNVNVVPLKRIPQPAPQLKTEIPVLPAEAPASPDKSPQPKPDQPAKPK